MEQYKFSDSNLEFTELLDIYTRLDTTYSDIYNFKINIYENCNLLRGSDIFSIPSVNIRLSSFRNNYIDVPIQDILDLNPAFYDANPTLFATVEHETYIKNIDLTNIIKTQFVNTTPSKIIIKINLHKEIVDADRSGALQINMKEIEEYFNYSLDTLELDILQYVTGKHGILDTSTDLAASDLSGGNGQNADVDSAGPAIFITDNDYPSSYFTLKIRTNGKVIGGFGASGGNGGNGKENLGNWTLSVTFPPVVPPYLSATNRVVASYSNVDPEGLEIPKRYELELTFKYEGFPDVKIQLFTEDGKKYFSDYDKLKTVFYDEGYHYPTPPPSKDPILWKQEIVFSMNGEPYEMHSPNLQTDSGSYSYGIKAIVNYWIRTPSSEDYRAPSDGDEGSTATYSNNARNVFNTQAGSPGDTYDTPGGTGGTAGKQGGITNITKADNINININIIEPIAP